MTARICSAEVSLSNILRASVFLTEHFNISVEESWGNQSWEYPKKMTHYLAAFFQPVANIFLIKRAGESLQITIGCDDDPQKGLNLQS